MRYFELKEMWSEKDPTNTIDPLDWWPDTEREMLMHYQDVKHSEQITHAEAEMLIGSNRELSHHIFNYKHENTPIPPKIEERIISIINRVVPIDKTFYRGVETEGYDDHHIMRLQSWAMNRQAASWFGDYIFETIGPVKGIEVGNIYYWYGLLYGDTNGLGDSQSEWLLLDPKKKLITGDT